MTSSIASIAVIALNCGCALAEDLLSANLCAAVVPFASPDFGPHLMKGLKLAMRRHYFRNCIFSTSICIPAVDEEREVRQPRLRCRRRDALRDGGHCLVEFVE